MTTVLRSASWVAALLAVLSLSACRPWGGDDAFDTERYRDVVEDAEDDGLNVYWLGREFEVEGLVLDEIDPSLSENDDGSISSIELHYFPNDKHEGGPVDGTLDVRTLRPKPGEEESTATIEPTGESESVERTELTVSGHRATLVTIYPFRGYPPNVRHLAIEFPDATVRLTTSAFYGLDGSNVNPLMNEATFLALAEQLRPYDE